MIGWVESEGALIKASVSIRGEPVVRSLRDLSSLRSSRQELEYPSYNMAELARPSRVMRRRIRDADSDSEAHTTQAETAQNGDQSSGIEQPSVSDILKQRKQAQKRKHGLAFSSSSQARRDMPGEDNSTQTTAAPKPVDSVYSRFTAQTGIIADAYDKKLFVTTFLSSSNFHSQTPLIGQ